MRYADHLERTGTRLYHGAGIRWMPYRGALIPASLVPVFPQVDRDTGRRLLAESGAWFLRWSSDPTPEASAWWWMVCREYTPDRLSGNTRHNIRRGRKKCRVERVDTAWLARSAYPCYRKAFDRFKNADPEAEAEFHARIMLRADDPSLFQSWWVHVGEELAGYLICTVEEGRGVSITEGRFDPAFLSCYPWLALLDAVLTEYVTGQGLPASNGERSVAHDTNMQDFLLRLGFQRAYCRLNIMYQPYLDVAVSCLYPFRSLIPDLSVTHLVRSALFQEEIRRGCLL